MTPKQTVAEKSAKETKKATAEARKKIKQKKMGQNEAKALKAQSEAKDLLPEVKKAKKQVERLE